MATATLLANNVSLDDTVPPGVGIANGLAHLLFDSATDEICYLEFRLPENYASAPVLKGIFSMASSTSGNVLWAAQVWAITPGDAADIDAELYDTVNTDAEAVPATAGYADEFAITLTNADSMAAGDIVRIKLYRNASNVSDTATPSGDAELRPGTIVLEYTTT